MTVPKMLPLDPAALVRHQRGFPTNPSGPVVNVAVFGLLLDCPSCHQRTTAIMAFFPAGVHSWQRHRVVLCNTETSLAVADAALDELAHLEHSIGHPAYNTDDPAELVNGCFHCDCLITGDDLAEEVRRTYLDNLVDLGHVSVPEGWLDAALAGAGTFLDHGDVPGLATVPDFPAHAVI